MKEYETGKIRNVCLAGHSSSGKTTLAEAILYLLKYTDRLGRVDNGNTVSDYDPEEVKRKVSINASLLPVEYDNHKLNLMDLPGYRDFIGEIRNGLRVADTALLVVDATSGVEVGTEFAWEYVQEFGVPCAFYINKLDKERANFNQALNKIKDIFNTDLAVLNLPMGQEADFAGVIDLVKMKAITEEKPGKPEFVDIPADHKEEAEQARAKLVELAAEGDDELTMKFLEDQPLTNDEVLRGLKSLVVKRKVAPVLCGAAYNCLGVYCLLDVIISVFPAPNENPGFVAGQIARKAEQEIRKYDPQAPFSAFVFKTVSDAYAGRLTFFKIISGEVRHDTTVLNANKRQEEKISHLLSVRGKKQENVHRLVAGDIGAVAKLEVTTTNDTISDPAQRQQYEATPMPSFTYSMAISAKSKTDEEKVGMAMHRLIEQDPTLEIRRDGEIRQTIISGMGDTHLDVAISRLKTSANVEVGLTEPRVPYKETITRLSDGQGKYKKQSGGRGQYGDVWLKLEPLERGAGFEFDWKIVGGVIPTKYKPSVEKGIKEAMEKGVIAGYQVVDMKATCYDGSYHAVDSSDIAFKVAASMAFKNVAAGANPILLEPIVNVKVTVPEANMGDIMGDLSGKRGRILGNERIGNKMVIMAQVPLAEMVQYSRELRSITQGRGIFELEFSHYEPVPPQLQEKIVAEAKVRKEEG